MDLLDRTIRFRGEGNGVFEVIVQTKPGNFTRMHFVITEGQYQYMPYSCVHMPYNKDIEVVIYAYVRGEAGEETIMTPIPKLDLRDSTEIILRYEEGRVNFEPVEGPLIARIRVVVELRELAKKFKLFVKHKLDRLGGRISRS